MAVLAPRFVVRLSPSRSCGSVRKREAAKRVSRDKGTNLRVIHLADPEPSLQRNLEVNMKMVKSLFLGSAAGLIAMSGAQAADLPVKAKAVEYVRICSLYGAGFFYIPGTDTCIKLGGYLRVDTTFNGGIYDGPNWNGSAGAGDRFYDQINSRSRMALTVDTRTATEYGVVRTFGQADFQFNNFGTQNGATPSSGPGGGIGAAGSSGNTGFLTAGQLSGLNGSLLDSPGGGYVAVEM